MIAALSREGIDKLNKDLPGYGDFLVETGRVVEKEVSENDSE